MNLCRRGLHPVGHVFQQSVERDLARTDDLLCAAQSLQENLRQETMSAGLVFIGRLVRARGRQYDPTLARELFETSLSRSGIARLDVTEEDLRTHSAGKTAVQKEDEARGRNARKPFL